MKTLKYSGLSELQEQVILGSLLGDASLHWTKNKPNYNSKLTKRQSKLDNIGADKKNYLTWFFNVLSPYSTKISEGISKLNGKCHPFYIFTSHCHEIFTELEKKWYSRNENGDHVFSHNKRIKIVPRDIKLTSLSVCVWFMDDGTLDAKNGNATFCTHGFTWGECEFLVQKLKNDVNIKSWVRKDYRNYPIIFVGVESYKDLISLIRPHVEWDCFQYKLDDSYNKLPQVGENHSQAKITETQAKEIIGLRRNGTSIPDIASKFNISTASVSLISSGNRWTHLADKIDVKKKPRLSNAAKEQIIQLHKTGCNQKTIASNLKINQSSVSRTIRRNNGKFNRKIQHC